MKPNAILLTTLPANWEP